LESLRLRTDSFVVMNGFNDYLLTKLELTPRSPAINLLQPHVMNFHGKHFKNLKYLKVNDSTTMRTLLMNSTLFPNADIEYTGVRFRGEQEYLDLFSARGRQIVLLQDFFVGTGHVDLFLNTLVENCTNLMSGEIDCAFRLKFDQENVLLDTFLKLNDTLKRNARRNCDDLNKKLKKGYFKIRVDTQVMTLTRVKLFQQRCIEQGIDRVEVG